MSQYVLNVNFLFLETFADEKTIEADIDSLLSGAFPEISGDKKLITYTYFLKKHVAMYLGN